MTARIAIVALIAIASPTMAADLGSTHEAVEVGPGKLHARAYRPLSRANCATPTTAHPVGGRIMAGAPEGLSDAACAKQEAAAQAQPNKG